MYLLIFYVFPYGVLFLFCFVLVKGGSKSFGCASARLVRAVEASLKLREARDAVVDESRPARTWSLRRLPVQRHNGQLGA